MVGAPAIKNGRKILRAALPGTDMLGFEVIPRPNEGFVKYLPCRIRASKEFLIKVLQPNSTTLIEITMQRIVSSTIFNLQKIENMPTKEDVDFSATKPGNGII